MEEQSKQHPAPEPTKPRNKSPIAFSIVFFIMFFLSAVLIYSYAETNQTTDVAVKIFFAGAGIFALILAVHALKWLFDILFKTAPNGKRSPFRLVASIVVILLTIGLLYYLYLFISYINFEQSLLSLQDTATEATMAKIVGDSIQASHKDLPSFASMSWVASTARVRTDWLVRYSANGKLDDYQKSLIAWTSQIRDLTSKSSDWKTIPAAPREFSLSINSRKASELLLVSIKELAELKQLGDFAVKNNDRQTMRYIAAKLLLQKHWLDGLGHSHDPGYLGRAFTKSAYAYEDAPRRVCNRDYRGNGVCYEEVATMTTDMYDAASAFADGEGEQQWEDMLSDENAYVLGCYGCVFTGEPAPDVTYPPLVQNFMNDCHGRGGTIDGASTVKTRMPTTESGYTCVYENNGQQCWDMLTYSGSYYAGGNPSCPEDNLLPMVVIEPPKDDDGDANTNSEPSNSDSNRSTNGGDADGWSCDLNGDYSVDGTIVVSSNFDALNFSQQQSDTISVRNNALIDDNGSAYPISSDGTVTVSMSVPVPVDSGASGGASAYVTYDFYCSGGRALVDGVFSGSSDVSDEYINIIIRFSGSMSGSKL